VVAQPLLFTIEFRRKMAELSLQERMEWLASLARRLRSGEDQPSLVQELREVARGCRLPLAESVKKQLGPFDALHLRALVEVPRERFVREEDLERSAEDVPLPLDEQGLATISAPHAYLLSFRLLELGPGDALVELGTGSGYGSALAAYIVGATGRVITFEIDGGLARWAAKNLEDERNVQVVHGDAVTSAREWGGAKKIVVTFAVAEPPAGWIDAIPEGGRLVAPVGSREKDQKLVLLRREKGKIVRTEHGAVRYVQNRSGK
jgi:protein-L-isoaspartate(D-aspartate) O-methyltransferase